MSSGVERSRAAVATTARRVGGRVRRRLRRLRGELADAWDAIGFRRARGRVRRAARRRPAELAMAVHLHYPDTWPAIAAHLRALEARSVPLYVTLTTRDAAVVRGIRVDFPAACCVVVPNRGRDVLPFLVVARTLAEQGCLGILKVHSKRSPHFELGGQWRDRMLAELVPDDADALDAIVETIRRPGTGVIGPAEAYFPLSKYWAGNAATVRRLLAGAVDGDPLADAEVVDGLGFFAGTMFWARLDAIRPLVAVAVRDFPREPTPKDGSMAHALERAFCALPALTGRTIFSSAVDGLRPVTTSAGAPAWYVDATREVWLAEQRAKRGESTDGPGDARVDDRA